MYMNYISQKQIFYINSYNRQTGDTSEFTVSLDIDNDVEWDFVTVLDASIPKSYYCIQAGLNSFTLVEDAVDYTITIPAGNYTRTSLCNVLIGLLNATTAWVYTITYSNIGITGDTGQLTFGVTGNDSQPQFIFTASSPYEQLGFDSNTTYNFSGNSLVSPNVINLAQEATLFISSDICQNKTDNILCNIITPQDSSFSFIVYTNTSVYEYSKVYTGSKSNIYSFRLQDENGNKINLNGLNMVFTLMLYKVNKIDQLLKGYIKMRTLMIQSEK
jgi:hypothetical protein